MPGVLATGNAQQSLLQELLLTKEGFLAQSYTTSTGSPYPMAGNAGLKKTGALTNSGQA